MVQRVTWDSLKLVLNNPHSLELKAIDISEPEDRDDAVTSIGIFTAKNAFNAEFQHNFLMLIDKETKKPIYLLIDDDIYFFKNEASQREKERLSN